jgi:hypothetical protein
MKTYFLASALALAASAACSSSSSAPTGADAGSGGDTGTGSDANAFPDGSGGDTGSGNDAASGDTWTSYVQGFFATYCVECHGPVVDPGRDFTTIADVIRDAATIRCGVAPTMQSGCAASPPPKQFPISDKAGTNPKPSDAERLRVVAWINAGTPQ